MLRTVFLLSPIFVTLFWYVTLASNSRTHTAPQSFLAKIMIFPLLLFLSHFFYFVPLPLIYPYFDIALQFTTLMVFPIYYVYFRLLTVELNFSLKAHGRYFVIPMLLTAIYLVGVMRTPTVEFRTWLFDATAYHNTPAIHFLNTMRLIILVTVLFQIVLAVVGNFFLIRNYGVKAQEYYSTINQEGINNVKIINYSMIFICFTAFTLTALGSVFLLQQELFIYVGWFVFSMMMYFIGYTGFIQKPINPIPDVEIVTDCFESNSTPLTAGQQELLNKLLLLFTDKKIYLNSHLNILEIVKLLGTNRTSISIIINKACNQNFCVFVNGYRIEAFVQLLRESPELSYHLLAERCGFGSVSSMQRIIFAQTGLTIHQWKNERKMTYKKQIAHPFLDDNSPSPLVL